MKNTLVKLMSNFIKLTKDEEKGIIEAFPIKSYSKGMNLLKEGQISKDAFIIIKGCVRKYAIINGDEKTYAFYTELQSAVNFESISNNSPSEYFFTCTEDSIVAILNSEKENELYKKFPRFGEVCRVEMEKMLGTSQEDLLNYKNSTPKERYLGVLKTRPELVQSVPQYQLASYLGIKPETLSRIRKRISLNE